jgi:hypothetical protein
MVECGGLRVRNRGLNAKNWRIADPAPKARASFPSGRGADGRRRSTFVKQIAIFLGDFCRERQRYFLVLLSGIKEG